MVLTGWMMAGPAQADPLEVKVTRHVIDREDRLNRPKLDAEEQTTELRVAVTNRSGKPTGELVVEWEILVVRAGIRENWLEKGRTKQASIENTQTVAIVTEPVTVVRSREGKQDLEYKITVRQAGKGGQELAQAVSDKAFDQLAASATRANAKKKK